MRSDEAFGLGWWVKWRLLGYRRRRGLGYAAERLAGVYLKKQGYRVLAYNVSSQLGEIDVLVEASDGTVVIVEVKSRSRGADSRFPAPEAMLFAKKQRKLSMLAGPLLRRFRLTDRRVRFDVVGVDWPEGGKPVLRHHAGAFESVF